MTTIHPTLKPLIQELKATRIKYYLASTEFDRLCNEKKIEEVWDSFIKEAEESSKSFILGFDHKAFDSENALISLLHHAFLKEDRKFFDWVICFVLIGFLKWSKEEVGLSNIFRDLKHLNVNEGYRVELKQGYDIHKAIHQKAEEIEIKKKPIIIKEKLLSFENKRKIWKKAIAKAEIENVVNEIIESGIDNEDDFIALSGRWNSLQNKYHKGVMKEEDVTIENNKIIHALLSLIKNLTGTEG